MNSGNAPTTVKDWMQHAVDSSLSSPIVRVKTGRDLFISGQGSAHTTKACVRSSYFRHVQDDYTTVSCTKCLRKMRDSSDLDENYEWAMLRALRLFDDRGFTQSDAQGPYRPLFDDARGGQRYLQLWDKGHHVWITELALQDLRDIDPDAPSAPLILQLADVIAEQSPKITDEEQDMFRSFMAVTAHMWAQVNYSRTTRSRNFWMDFPIAFHGDDKYHPMRDHIVYDVTQIGDMLIDNFREGKDWNESVQSVEWSPSVVRSIENQPLWMVEDVPDTLRLRREDFPSSASWLRAEYALTQTTLLKELLDDWKAGMTALQPTDYRAWLTVTVPKKFPTNAERIDNYLSWYNQAMVKNRRVVQLPLTVLAMLCRLTGTRLLDWRPQAGDMVAQSTIDAALALLGNDMTLGILEAYSTACAVTGAEEDETSGTPDLSVSTAPRRKSKKKTEVVADDAEMLPMFAAS